MASILNRLASPRVIQCISSPQNKLVQLNGPHVEARKKLFCSPRYSSKTFEQPVLQNSPAVFKTPVKKTRRRLSWDETDSLKRKVSGLRKEKRASSTSTPIEPCVDTTPQRTAVLSTVDTKSKWSILGKGGFGIVIRAQYQGQKVAMKIFPKHYSSCNEINAVNLSHFNITRVLKVMWNNEVHPIVLMERFGDMNLQKLIDNHDFDLNSKRRISYARDIAKALDYCHNRSILHLDVKPKNVLVDLFEEVCKLCDFGSCKKIGEEVCHQCPTVNTVVYTDPHLLQGHYPTIKTDTYSYGITLWQMLCKKMPFQGKHLHEIIYQVVACGVRPVTSPELRASNKKYVDLYELCWLLEEYRRPRMNFIIQHLENSLA